MQATAQLEINRLEKNLGWLSSLAEIAPMMGFLGTVLGMIQVFMVLSVTEHLTNPQILSGGIYEAMLTTAFGLAIALPVMVAHAYLVSRVDRYEAQLQDGTVTFVKAVGGQSGGQR